MVLSEFTEVKVTLKTNCVSDVNRDTVFTRASYAPELSPSSAARGTMCVARVVAVEWVGACVIPLLLSSLHLFLRRELCFLPLLFLFRVGGRRRRRRDSLLPPSCPVPCPPPSDPKLPICCCLTSHILICMGPPYHGVVQVETGWLAKCSK